MPGKKKMSLNEYKASKDKSKAELMADRKNPKAPKNQKPAKPVKNLGKPAAKKKINPIDKKMNFSDWKAMYR